MEEETPVPVETPISTDIPLATDPLIDYYMPILINRIEFIILLLIFFIFLYVFNTYRRRKN